MTDVSSLLGRLDALGVELTVERRKLRWRGPRGAMTEELRSEIDCRRDAIIEAVRARSLETWLLYPDDDESPLLDDPAVLELVLRAQRAGLRFAVHADYVLGVRGPSALLVNWTVRERLRRNARGICAVVNANRLAGKEV